MGPPENLTRPGKRQGAGQRKQSERRPRQRRCLLKGCEQRFHPRQAGQRYCSEDCRKAARKWSRWKAQQRYRETVAGKAKRNQQSRCYRQRAKTREASDPAAVKQAARVITPKHFFSSTPATGRGATSDSRNSVEVPCSVFVRRPAGERWNGLRSGSGAGNRRGI
jgi:hypothetical protein